MKKLILAFAMSIFFISCDRNEKDTPEPLDYGYLSLNLSLNITSEPANGRTLAVNTDDFRVTIFAANGTEVMVFDPFSSAPAEVSLPTGEYYVEAHSNNLVDAAFENPYYFGRSDNFTIDKEELKSIDIEAELANTKVAINYSANVVNTFHSYTGTVTVASSGASLFYAQGETREGYFLTSPLDIEVNLSYTKLDGTTIDRTFTATIADPQPRTLYNINVDATLEDGKIVFNITVDEGFDTVDIDLGDNGNPQGGGANIVHVGGSSNDVPVGVFEQTNGNLLVFAQTLSTDFDSPATNGGEFWIFEITRDGEMARNMTIGSQGYDRLLNAVKISDGYLLMGYSGSSDGLFFQRPGIDRFGGVLVKLDLALNVVWVSYNNSFEIMNAYEMANGNIATCGSFSQIDMNSNVSMHSSNGALLWSYNFGGSGLDYATEIIETSNNNLLVTSFSTSTDGDISSSHGGSDIWMMGIDGNGSLLWEKSIGGSGNEFATSVEKGSNGSVILAGGSGSTNGDFGPNNGGDDGFILTTDESGTILSLKSYGAYSGDGFADMELMADGSMVLTGYKFGTGITVNGRRSTDMWFVRVSAAGDIIDESIFGGITNDYGRAITAIQGNGYALVGVSGPDNVEGLDAIFDQNYGREDIWILRLDANGALQ